MYFLGNAVLEVSRVRVSEGAHCKVRLALARAPLFSCILINATLDSPQWCLYRVTGVCLSELGLTLR